MNKLLDAEDVLAHTRDLVECAASAAAHVWGEEADHVAAPLEVASSKIDEAIDLLREYRESKDSAGPVPAAPDTKPKSRPTRPAA
jgi:hypothetical protein